MLKPSECIDRVNSAGGLLLVLEVDEDFTFGRPAAKGILDRVELRCRVFTLAESVAREGSGDNIRRLEIFAFGNAECGTMKPKHRIHFVGKP